MKTISLFLFFAGIMGLCKIALAQDKVSYSYDAAGNRISRIIVMGELRADEPEVQEEETAYSEMLSELLIKIYPNPTRGLIRIEIQNLPVGETANITLYELSGKLITMKQTSESTEIDITGQPAGIYLMKIIAGEKQTEWKIIKK
jgi:hypothetical protein